MISPAPWVRAAVTPWSTELLRWLHPMRMSRYLFSERFNPWMEAVAGLAGLAHRSRRPVPNEHPLHQIEREFSKGISTMLATLRQQRDETFEQAFRPYYGAGSPDR